MPAPLESEIRSIYQRSPLYTKRFPLHADPLQWSCYSEIPVLTKKEILERGPSEFFEDYAEIDRAIQRREYEYEHTSGSTAQPMTVIMENGWWDAQTERAYRSSSLLAPFVGQLYRKAILAPVGCSSNLCPTQDQPFPQRFVNGTIYLNLTSDPFVFPESEWDRIVVELQAVKPEVLEGEPVYLSLLARAVKKRKVTLPSLKVVILTYGKASLQHSRRIAESFPVHQVDLYGSTEAGYLFVGEAFKDSMQVIDSNAFIELGSWRENQSDVFQIFVTTRDREAMPLLRYNAGDIVRRTATGFRLLGRERDLYFRRDGSLVSSFEIDAALPAGFSCWHYTLVQTSENRWDFQYVADHEAPEQVASALASLLGDGTRVNAFRRRFIQPGSSGKFSLLKPLAK